jgi:hypothetical protein
MSKLSTALASALAIASLVAGGVAARSHPAPRPARELAGPPTCCISTGTGI